MITKLVFPIFECAVVWLLCVVVLDRDIPFKYVPEVETRIKEDTIYFDSPNINRFCFKIKVELKDEENSIQENYSLKKG